MNKHMTLHARRAQRGAILIAVLAILVALTILGLAGMRSTTLEERMAGNFMEKYLAFQAAEAALRMGEEAVGPAASFENLPFNGTAGTYNVEDTTGAVDPFTAFDSDSNVVLLPEELGFGEGTAYFIEQLPEHDMHFSSEVMGFPSTTTKVRYYRITGKGVGRSADSLIILQSIYFR
jgi:type IV pilus assembly protein PilX